MDKIISNKILIIYYVKDLNIFLLKKKFDGLNIKFFNFFLFLILI